MRAESTRQKTAKPVASSRKQLDSVTELSTYLAERERHRQSLVHNLKGKFSDMKFSSDDLVKQRRAETLLEGR